jgi:hypothetical protein
VPPATTTAAEKGNDAAKPRARPGEPAPLRVGFAGGALRSGLATGVQAVGVGRSRRRLGAEPPAEVEGLDALVVDGSDAALDGEALRALCERARATGVPVIGIRRGGPAPEWSGLADVETGAPGSTPELTAAPAVDLRRYNPGPFSNANVAGYLAVVDSDADGAAIEASAGSLTDAMRFGPVFVEGPAELTARLPAGVVGVLDPGLGDEAWLESLHQHLAVLDHPSFHASDFERSGWIAKLCAAGVPVCAEQISDGLAELLGAELAGLLDGLRARDMADLDARERASVALRRTALRSHSPSERWRQIGERAGIEVPGRPMVSVILSTRRESWLEHGIAQVARQTYEPRELVVCLHGDEFQPGTTERVRSLYKGKLKVLRVDGELTLGDALNAGVEASEGELVTKMDDDDYYSTEHLWDLALALEYSGADLVGKGAEFVYLTWIDLTMRRFMGDGESDHPRLAGGALMARKGPLEEIGGWPSRSRGEDTWIVKNFKRAGHKTYRTHGYGYILNRHGRGHTWNTYVDYFLIQSQREWRGLRFDKSAIES